MLYKNKDKGLEIFWSVWPKFFVQGMTSKRIRFYNIISLSHRLLSQNNLDDVKSTMGLENYKVAFVFWIRMPCPFTGPKMVCAGPNFFSQSKNLTAFSAVTKKQFYSMQIIFLSGTKCLWLPQYVNRFLVWHKNFWPAQNILGPVKGQGIT